MTIKHVPGRSDRQTNLEEDNKKHVSVEKNEEKYKEELRKYLPRGQIEDLTHFSAWGGKDVALRFKFKSTGLVGANLRNLSEGTKIVLKAFSKDTFQCDIDLKFIE
jgi:Holliday junction resolvase